MTVATKAVLLFFAVGSWSDYSRYNAERARYDHQQIGRMQDTVACLAAVIRAQAWEQSNLTFNCVGQDSHAAVCSPAAEIERCLKLIGVMPIEPFSAEMNVLLSESNK